MSFSTVTIWVLAMVLTECVTTDQLSVRNSPADKLV